MKFSSTPKPGCIIESACLILPEKEKETDERTQGPNEIRTKAYSVDPELLHTFKNEILSTYSKSSVSRILGPDNEGSYWMFINVYPGKIRRVS